MAVLIRRPAMLLLNCIIAFGQAYLKLDAFGFDAMFIGLLVVFSIKLRTKFIINE